MKVHNTITCMRHNDKQYNYFSTVYLNETGQRIVNFASNIIF